jgi:Tfp pilus assembly protein PilV
MSRAKVFKRLAADDGLGMLEIVVSAVIFFFVLTAVLGLLGTTTQMSIAAKQRAVMTNAINAYVERVSAMPFAQVKLASEGGALSEVETQTVGEFTVVIRPTVSIPTTMTSAQAPTLKRLRLQVTVTRGSANPISYTTEVLIRDRDTFLTQAVSSPQTDPTIAFTSSTPAAGTVVWGSQHAGGALTIGARADAATGRTVSSVILWCDDQYILKDTMGNLGSWANIDQQSFTTPSFVWNTLQTDELGNRVIVDGYRTVSAYVLDSGGVSKYTVRHFLVDNDPPPLPTTSTVEPLTATETRISWGEVMDGTTPADHYHVEGYKQSATSDTWTFTDYVGGTNVFKGTSGTFVTQPFSRYYMRMQAHSARNLRLTDWYYHPRAWISPPTLAASSSISDSNQTVTLTCSAPQFPYSSITYRVYRGTSQTNLTLLTTASSNTWAETYKKQEDYYYRFEVTVTPTGTAGGILQAPVPVTLRTNIVGPL